MLVDDPELYISPCQIISTFSGIFDFSRSTKTIWKKHGYVVRDVICCPPHTKSGLLLTLVLPAPTEYLKSTATFADSLESAFLYPRSDIFASIKIEMLRSVKLRESGDI